MNTNEKFSSDIPSDQRGIIKGQLGFSTIFYFQDIVDYETKNDQWKKDILDASIQEGVMKSNIFGWQSDFVKHDHMSVEFLSILHNLHDVMHLDKDYAPVIDTMWFNVNSKGSYNKTHTHPGCQLSFVYYVQCPEKCGMISFEDPREQAWAVQLPFAKNPDKGWQGDRPDEYAQEIYWQSAPGRIIIFPSWLRHSVEPNQSDELRISVSGNISFRNK